MVFPSSKLYDDVYGFAPQSERVQSMYALADALKNGGIQSAVDPAQQMADDQFKKVMQLTQGRANELRQDPVQQQVMQYLKGVLGGKNMPYTDNTMNALKAQFGKGSASAEAAQMQTLRDSIGATGGSIYDPSYQAASREAQSQRQGANLDYAGQLNAQAGLANFQAQQNAGGMLGSLRNAQNAQINGLSQAAAGMQAGRFFEQPTAAPGAPTTLMPQYGGGGQMGMAGQAGAAGQPSAKPQATTQAPGTAPMPTQTALRPQQPPAEQPFGNKFSFNRLLPLAEPQFQFPKGY